MLFAVHASADYCDSRLVDDLCDTSLGKSAIDLVEDDYLVADLDVVAKSVFD